MPAELETLLDKLAEDFDRQVVIEGPDFELLAYSRPLGVMDEVRVNTILSRHAPHHVRGRLLDCGVGESADPIWMDSDSELQMMPRLCVPIRSDGRFMGSMWFINKDETISGDQVQAAVSVVPSLGGMLADRCRHDKLVSRLDDDELRALVLSDGDAAGRVIQRIEDSEIFATTEPVQIHIITESEPDDSDADSGQIHTILERCRCAMRSRQAAYFVNGEEGVFLAPGSRGDDVGVHLQRSAKMVKHDGRFTVAQSGLGTISELPKLFGQARRALHVAQATEPDRSIIRWQDIGIYQVLGPAAESEYLQTALNDRLVALMSGGNHETMLRTLECYLDNGGSVKATTEELMLHRTSLYYRLDRIEELLEIDIHDGRDRLSLHVGLKLARLAGLYEGEGHAVLL